MSPGEFGRSSGESAAGLAVVWVEAMLMTAGVDEPVAEVSSTEEYWL
jgi:hypothetical protein